MPEPVQSAEHEGWGLISLSPAAMGVAQVPSETDMVADCCNACAVPRPAAFTHNTLTEAEAGELLKAAEVILRHLLSIWRREVRAVDKTCNLWFCDRSV